MLAGWSYYKTITLDNADALLTDFPAFVVITADADIGAHALATGYDLRFTLDDDTLLKYQRIAHTVAGGLATGLYRVKIPSWSAVSGALIRCYYGKADATDGADPENVYDATTEGAWLFNASGDLDCLDSTANNNDGSNTGVVSAAGPLSGLGAGNFADAGDKINFGTGASLDLSGDFTLDAWVNPTTTSGVHAILGKHDAGVEGYLLYILTGKLYVQSNAGTLASTSSLSTGDWHHVVGLIDSGTFRVYVDGDPDGNPTGGTDPIVHAHAAYAGMLDGAYWQYAGLIAVPTIHSAVRSAAWIHAEYHNVADADHMQAWGAEVAAEPALPVLSARLLLIIQSLNCEPLRIKVPLSEIKA